MAILNQNPYYTGPYIPPGQRRDQIDPNNPALAPQTASYGFARPLAEVMNMRANPNVVDPETNPQSTNDLRGSGQDYLNYPDQDIDMNEMLIRTGGAIAGGAAQGGLQGYAAGAEEYGRIKDLNRAQGLEKFKYAQAEAAKKEALKAKNEKLANKIKMDAFRNRAQLSTARQALQGLKNEDGSFKTGITGGIAGNTWLNRAKTAFTTNERTVEQNRVRMLLQGIKVDATLANTANTKGAISNREMALFESPIPTLEQNEEYWGTWLDEYISALESIDRMLQSEIGGLTGSNNSDLVNRALAIIDG